MGSSLGAQTRHAAVSAEIALPALDLDLVERTRQSTNDRSGERDSLLEEIIRRYRAGQRRAWSAVLLDLMTPAILSRLGRYRPEPPAVDLEDIRQQFVVELLEAALTMPMPAGARFVERRLVLRAGQGVRRWLRTEHSRQMRSDSLQAVIELEEMPNGV